MAKITNTLIANVTAQEDSTQNVIINRSTGNPALDSSVAQMMEYFALLAGANVIPLPINPCTELYIRNIDSAKTITVNWTPNGGAANNVILLNPNDQIIFWALPGTTTPGITALSMTPSTAGALVEYFLGG
jgi:hypothetical protein